MDPTTVILITLAVLAGGGASGAAVAAVRRKRRARLERALRREQEHDGRSLSLVDVFWDLGASDFALELMRSDELLPADADEVAEAHRRLDAIIESHGSYRQYIDDSLEAIREFHEAGADAANRREIPTLETRARKLLPVGGGEDSASFEASALVPKSADEREWHGRAALGTYVDESLDEKRRMREARRVPGIRIEGRVRAPDRVVDVDDIAGFEPDELLTSLVEGRIGEQIQQWWEGRQLRSLKKRLDRAFEDIYDYYVAQVDRTPNFYDNLFDTADKWEREAERIAGIREQTPLDDHPASATADLLLQVAEETARSIAGRAERETTEAIERIHEHARRGDFAMAGYLVYLNHHALFAGRGDEYGKYVRRIRNTAHKVKREMRDE